MTQTNGGTIILNSYPVTEALLPVNTIIDLSTQLSEYGFSGEITEGYSVTIHETYSVAESGVIISDADITYVVIKTGGVWWISGKQVVSETPEDNVTTEVLPEEVVTETPTDTQASVDDSSIAQ